MVEEYKNEPLDSLAENSSKICGGCGCNHKIESTASEGRTCPSKQGIDCIQGAEDKDYFEDCNEEMN